MTRHLRKGVHYVNIPGQGRRKVKVLASGKWRFMRGGHTKKHRGTRRRSSRGRRHWVPGHWSR